MNRMMLFLAVAALAAVLGAPAVSMATDRFEPDGAAWQTGATDNEMTPGSAQQHDMEGAADEDWIILSQRPFSSYEFRVDEMGDELTFTTGTGDIMAVDLVESDGTVVATGYNMNPAGVDRVVTFQNTAATPNDERHMRMSSPACSGGCTANSIYAARLFDTTYSIPRFNNSATQVTVMILHNNTDRSVDTNAFFFDATGTLLSTINTSISAHGTAVVNTSADPALVGQSGAINITNSAGYGGLSGKGVALEPGTGFTFDTMMVPRQP